MLRRVRRTRLESPNPGFVSCHALQMYVCANRQSYQNVSRETFLFDSAKTIVACFETIASRSPQREARRRALLAPSPRCYSLPQPTKGESISVDSATVRRIAHLARIKVSETDVPHLQDELNAILAFVEQLATVEVEGVEPMTSVMPMPMKKRADIVTDGSIPDKIVANAPVSDDHFFVVPKVVE